MSTLKAEVLFFFAFLSVFFSVANAQVNTTVGNWEEVIEQLSSGDEAINPDNFMEDLPAHPLNINTISKEELEQFPFLTDIQVENILAYLYIHGQMQTLYELQMVEEMDKQTIDCLIPFLCAVPITSEPPLPSLKKVFKYGKNELIARFDIPFYRRKGYEKEYLGPSNYHSMRYAFHYKDNIYAGITAEKDAGEPFLALHNKKGYDYYSFYFYLKNIRFLKTLAIGNYRLSFGQGLVISNDFMFGKSSSVSTASLRSNSIKKHSSTDEYNYFRGVAAAIQYKNFVFSGFYSHRSLDGISTGESITSIHKTGLHRTEKEAERKEAFVMQLAGGNITYDKGLYKVGFTGVYYYFDRPYKPQQRNYSKYNIRGNYFHNMSLDYKIRWNRFTLSGEIAFDKRQKAAILNTLSYSPGSAYKFMVVQRYYAHDYWALFARSFSEGGYVQNENGYYFAAEAAPLRYWKFFLSMDFFQFPWWKYLVDKPSRGFDGIIQATFSPRDNLSMFARYQYKQKEKNYTDEDKTKDVRPVYRHKLRYRLTYSPADRMLLKSTFDYTVVYPEKGQKSRGIQLVQAATYALGRIPLKIELQASYFHTNDYDSRVYSYEKGMLYTFYTPSFYGRGSRMTAHIRWDIHKDWMLIAKYGQTIYYDRQEIGSGLDIINGNKKQDIQLQLRARF